MDYNDYDKMFLDEYDKMLYPEMEKMVTESTSAQAMLKQGNSSIKPIETTVIEDALSYAGIKLEDMGKFLENIGSVNVGGIDFTLKDLMPIGDGVISALKLAGSGMPMTTGKGMTTALKPELNMAAAEIGVATALANPVAAGLKSVAKSIVKNKAKVATGAAAVVGTSSKQNERIKYGKDGKRILK